MFEFGLLMVLRPTRAALRFIIREPGEQYVTMPGMKETPLWCVACWDTPLGSSYCCSSYGRGSDTIWLDNVSCQGNESSIVDCKHSEWGINNCTHASDAGVYCYGPTPAEPSTVPAPTPTSTPSMSLVQLYCVILYHVMPCHAISCYVMLLCYVMLCYVMLWLCYFMFCYLSDVMFLLCCVVLCYVMFKAYCLGFCIMLS